MQDKVTLNPQMVRYSQMMDYTKFVEQLSGTARVCTERLCLSLRPAVPHIASTLEHLNGAIRLRAASTAPDSPFTTRFHNLKRFR